MESIDVIAYLILLAIGFYILWRLLQKKPPKRKHVPRRKKPKRKTPKRKKGEIVLTPKLRAKADKKYAMLLNKFKRTHKRKPTKDDLFRVVITASHHTLPVKGRNSRRWMRGKRGHWGRQKVRKYLLEKHKIVKDYRMK